MVLIHVFARGNGLLFWKSIPGLGENPRGGSDEITELNPAVKKENRDLSVPPPRGTLTWLFCKKV